MKVDFKELEGKIITSINEEHDSIYFYCSDGSEYLMHHIQDCCESVWIEDVCGDWEDIFGQSILQAFDITEKKEFSPTWTFYVIVTNKATITIRWCGTSNGYYSEKVTFTKIK